MIKVKAKLNNLRVSPRKAQLVAKTVRGKAVREALAMLDYDLRHVAAPLAKLVRSAQANALNNFQLKEADLIIAEVHVGAGPTMKRWRPRAYGRASKILKRTSRITVILTTAQETTDTPKTATKKATKKSVKKASQSKKDDLTKIEGIGPKIATALSDAGIKRFKDLEQASQKKIKDAIADVKGVHDPASWAQQAKLAAQGQWEELATLQEKLIGGKKQ